MQEPRCGHAESRSACPPARTPSSGRCRRTRRSPASTGPPAANPCRDIKVYSDHAFVVADYAGPHGMQVVDLTQPISSVVLCDPRCP